MLSLAERRRRKSAERATAVAEFFADSDEEAAAAPAAASPSSPAVGSARTLAAERRAARNGEARHRRQLVDAMPTSDDDFRRNEAVCRRHRYKGAAIMGNFHDLILREISSATMREPAVQGAQQS